MIVEVREGEPDRGEHVRVITLATVDEKAFNTYNFAQKSQFSWALWEQFAASVPKPL